MSALGPCVSWEITVKRNDRVVVLVAANSLSKCIEFLGQHFCEVWRAKA